MRGCWWIFLLACFAVGCNNNGGLQIKVKNPAGLDRTKETVEVNWRDIKCLAGITEKNVVVTDETGKEISSQVVFAGQTEPQKLIFQVSLSPYAEKIYRVKEGQPALYKPEVYGRFVPERMDDYAWENTLVGHRVYGPALEAAGEISNGIDVWVKKTGELLIDEWYKTGDYHKDHGKGMDCYKVGRTLGAGALAPFVDRKIVLANNYVKQQTLDSGPIRISFRLEYAPFVAGKDTLMEIRTISLDANSRFNRIEEKYRGTPGTMEVAAGIVSRQKPGLTLLDQKAGLLGYWEAQNNDNGDNNGHVAVGVIFPEGAKDIVCEQDHWLAISDYVGGSPFVYYMGSAWSKGGVATAEAWFEEMRREKEKRNNPIQTEVIGF